MQTPRVNPVGVLEHPPGFVGSAHRKPFAIRLAARALLLAFLGVTAATTALSAGAWCLISDVTSPSPLHGSGPARGSEPSRRP